MKRIIITVVVSAITSLLTVAGSLEWLIRHSVSLPTITEKDGTVIGSELRLAQGVVYSTIRHKNVPIPTTRSVYLFDPEHTVIFDNGRDRTHHRFTIQTHPLPGIEVIKTFNPDQAKTDQPILSRLIANQGTPNEAQQFFDETGGAISEREYFKIIAEDE